MNSFCFAVVIYTFPLWVAYSYPFKLVGRITVDDSVKWVVQTALIAVQLRLTFFDQPPQSMMASSSTRNSHIESRILEDKVDRLARTLAKTHDDLTIKQNELRILQKQLEASQS